MLITYIDRVIFFLSVFYRNIHIELRKFLPEIIWFQITILIQYYLFIYTLFYGYKYSWHQNSSRLGVKNTPTASLQRGKILPFPTNEYPVAQSAGAVEYTDCITTEEKKPHQQVSYGPSRQRLKNTPTASLQRGKTSPPSHSQRVFCSPVGWSCRIHRLHLCRGVKTPTNEYPVAHSAGAEEYTDCISAEG